MAIQVRFLRKSLEAVLRRPWLVATLVVSTPSTVWASEVFPPHLIAEYGWVGQPNECTLCHLASPGTAGTATKPFARALMTNGLIPRITTSLDSALTALGDTDSDGDGASDFVELTMAGDPNDPAILPGQFVAKSPVEYGCVGTIARSNGSSSTTALVAAGVVALVLLRSRRRAGGAT
jgi:hypothetical protein